MAACYQSCSSCTGPVHCSLCGSLGALGFEHLDLGHFGVIERHFGQVVDTVVGRVSRRAAGCGVNAKKQEGVLFPRAADHQLVEIGVQKMKFGRIYSEAKERLRSCHPYFGWVSYGDLKKVR